ncbi:MAG: RimK family alpha-L-glutamate ligase [Desulfatibacillaceae bacterium]
MIVSFHPMIVAPVNRLCAGRDPGPEELAAIRGATAVILPQACRETLYRMARDNAPLVFPNYDARFAWPGKLGQVRMFRETGLPCPKSVGFFSVEEYRAAEREGSPRLPDFPVVFKFDWGGEGETVFFVEDRTGLDAMMERARQCEASGMFGFLVQEYVPHGGRCLRVVVMHDSLRAYCRVAEDQQVVSAGRGAEVVFDVEPAVRDAGFAVVRELCRATGIDLAGVDLLYPEVDAAATGPQLIEVNYFFGRRGLGGSDRYYELLENAVDRWLAGHGLSR